MTNVLNRDTYMTTAENQVSSYVIIATFLKVLENYIAKNEFIVHGMFDELQGSNLVLRQTRYYIKQIPSYIRFIHYVHK